MASERIATAPEFIDAHLHVVSPDVERYPLRPRGFARDWWTDREVDVTAVTRTLVQAQVGRGVLVQAVGPYGNDNRYARDAAAGSGGRFAFVAAIDADGDDPGAELRAVIAAGGVAGVRVFAAGGNAAWMHDRRGAQIWAAAAECTTNLVVACLAPHLEALGALCAAHPDQIVAIDHCGFADLSGGPPYRAAGALFDLAAIPAVHLKISTIVLEAARANGGEVAFVEAAVARFGSARLAWGSDHPQTYEVAYSDMVADASESLSTLPAGDARNVLHDTAARLWFGEV